MTRRMLPFIRWVLPFVLCSFQQSGSAHSSQSGETAPDAPIVIEGGTLIDGTGAAPLTDAIIVLEGNRIKAVGKRGAVPVPAGAKVLTATGKYILPGLIDMHTHYRDWVPELFLRYGVTTIRDLGNPTEWMLAQRDGVSRGKLRGPRMFVSGNLLNPGPASRPHHTSINTIDEARASTRELIAKGVDQIKVHARITAELLEVVAEEAHKAGVPVVADLGLGAVTDARAAALAGIDALEHASGVAMATIPEPRRALADIDRRYGRIIQGDGEGGWLRRAMLHSYMDPAMFPGLVRVMVDEHVYLAPNLINVWKRATDRRATYELDEYEIFRDVGLQYIPAEFRMRALDYRRFDAVLSSADIEQLQKGFRNAQEFVREYIKGGGQVIAASDTASVVVPGVSLHREMELLVDAGLTPMQAIMAATKVAAEALRHGTQLGTVTPGKLADLIIVADDPLRDIANTRKVETVIKDGKIQDTSYHPQFTNPIPRPHKVEGHGNPVPSISTIAPLIVTEGSDAVRLTVRGAGFISASGIKLDGIGLPTVFKDPTQLEAIIPVSLLTRVGTFPITVNNPPPRGGSAMPAYLIVNFK